MGTAWIFTKLSTDDRVSKPTLNLPGRKRPGFDYPPMKLPSLFRLVGAAGVGVLVLAGAPALSAQTAASLKASGLAKMKEGSLDDAIVDFTSAIALNPNDPTLYSNRAVAKTGQTNYGGAVEDYGAVIKLRPGQANGYLLRGLANLYMGNIAGAGQDCSKAIELEPSDATYYLYRGLVRDCDNDQAEAITDYAKAMELGAKTAPLMANYAQIYRGLDLRKTGADASGDLGDYAAWTNPWTKAIAGYLSGKLTDAQFLASAGASAKEDKTRQREKAEAYYFTGRVHAQNGDTAGAKAAFSASYDLQYPGDIQRHLAQLEFERLNAAH